jgi:hypothetical protein
LLAPEDVTVTVPRYEPAARLDGLAITVIVAGVVDDPDVTESQLPPELVLELRLKLAVLKPLVVSATCPLTGPPPTAARTWTVEEASTRAG